MVEKPELLLDEVSSQERGRRVEFFGIQLDEMWTLVQNQETNQWLWRALNPANRQIMAFPVGGRSEKDAPLFYEKIPDVFKQTAGFFSDYWQAYGDALKNKNHFGV